jgi:hypothetical protein
MDRLDRWTDGPLKRPFARASIRPSSLVSVESLDEICLCDVQRISSRVVMQPDSRRRSWTRSSGRTRGSRGSLGSVRAIRKSSEAFKATCESTGSYQLDKFPESPALSPTALRCSPGDWRTHRTPGRSALRLAASTTAPIRLRPSRREASLGPLLARSVQSQQGLGHSRSAKSASVDCPGKAIAKQKMGGTTLGNRPLEFDMAYICTRQYMPYDSSTPRNAATCPKVAFKSRRPGLSSEWIGETSCPAWAILVRQERKGKYS